MEQPTVDTAEVVRCKNCRLCETHYPQKRLDQEAKPEWYCTEYKRYRNPDDFCSDGKPKEG